MNYTRLLPFFLFLPALALFFSCSDNTVVNPVFDAAKQAPIDDSLIVDYLSRRGVTDSFSKKASGLYVRISKKYPDSLRVSSDSMALNADTALIIKGVKVFFRYEGKLLNDTLFDENLTKSKALDFIPGSNNLIQGFEQGILYFRNREEGELLIPSALGYGNTVQGKIPRNSCLRFFVRITNVER
jgi:hypothetical protein